MIHSGRRVSMCLGFGPPTARRGFLPLVLAAIGSGLVRGAVGAIQGNQKKQRNKGYIDANYRLATDKLNTNQALARQNSAEALNARGLVAGAMRSGTGQPTTLGGQVTSDMNHQLGLERQDLENQHDQALKENKAEYTDTLINSAVAGAQTGMSVYSAGSALRTPNAGASMASSASSPVARAMMSGGPDESHIGLGGVDVVDPLGHPGSSWYQGSQSGKTTINGAGLSNSDFNVG